MTTSCRAQSTQMGLVGCQTHLSKFHLTNSIIARASAALTFAESAGQGPSPSCPSRPGDPPTSSSRTSSSDPGRSSSACDSPRLHLSVQDAFYSHTVLQCPLKRRELSCQAYAIKRLGPTKKHTHDEAKWYFFLILLLEDIGIFCF